MLRGAARSSRLLVRVAAGASRCNGGGAASSFARWGDPAPPSSASSAPFAALPVRPDPRSLRLRSFSSGKKEGGDGDDGRAEGDKKSGGGGAPQEEVEASSRRLPYIHMDPTSLSRLILPGGHSVLRTNPRTGEERRVFAERALGYFWMLKDIRDSPKPILANGELVEAGEARKMPPLWGCRTLGGDGTGTVNLPDWFYRNNRSRDSTAQCTLVGISYKDYGHKMLSSWLDPFRDALCSDSSDATLRGRYSVATLSINEGRVLSWLSGPITKSTESNTPEERRGETLLYFGDALEFRDALRMHNTLAGYVYLLDGIGRVRWAGSGRATEAEVKDLIRFARELTPSRKVAASQQVRGGDGDDGGGRGPQRKSSVTRSRPRKGGRR